MALDNPVLRTIRDGGTAGMVWLSLGSTAVAELAADAGPDAVVFDLQHGLWQRQSLQDAIGIVRARTTPMARVADGSTTAIGEALDAGVLGVIVPLVETAEQATAAVAAAKYPPDGIRSGGGVRPLMDFKAYGVAANDAVLVAVMIETAKGVENAAAIAAVPGVDLVFIGTGDLALSIGTFPEFGPEHEAAVEAVQQACRDAGTPCGAFTPHLAFAHDRRRQGFQAVVIAEDIGLVHGAAKTAIKGFVAGSPVPVAGAVAFVTGTSRGIGPEIVRALLAAGVAKVYCATRTGDAAAGLIAEAPDRLVPVTLDITDPDAVAGAAETAADTTLLVNNAGVNFNTPLLAIDHLDNARAEIETNYFGTLAMCRAFAPVLKANGGGAIVTLLSILARGNLPMMGSLAASKAAELSMTQGLRAELKGQGTHVMAVLPGAVDTDMTRDFEGPKIPPADVAEAIVHGLAVGAEEVMPGDMASGMSMGLAVDPKAVERQLAEFLPK